MLEEPEGFGRGWSMVSRVSSSSRARTGGYKREMRGTRLD